VSAHRILDAATPHGTLFALQWQISVGVVMEPVVMLMRLQAALLRRLKYASVKSNQSVAPLPGMRGVQLLLRKSVLDAVEMAFVETGKTAEIVGQTARVKETNSVRMGNAQPTAETIFAKGCRVRTV